MNQISDIARDPPMSSDDDRRQRLLYILLATTALMTAAMALILLILPTSWVGSQAELNRLLRNILILLFMDGLIYLIGRYVSQSAARALFVLLLVGLAAVSDEPARVVDGRALILFAIPILAASALLRPWASFVAAGLSSLSVAVIGVFVVEQKLPNIPGMFIFFILAHLAYLASHSLEETMRRLRESNEKRAAVNEQLRASEERFHTAIEGLSGGVFAHDREGNLLLVNEAACLNTGWSRQELLNMSVADIEPDSAARNDRERLWQKLKSGESAHLKVTHRRKDGSEYPAELYLTRITLEGEPAMLGAAYDISERQQAEWDLEQQRHLMTMLLQHAPDIIFFKDLDSRFIRINPAAAEELGIEHPSQAVGKTDADFYSGEHTRTTRRLEKGVMETGKPLINVEEHYVDDNGIDQWGLVTRAPLRDRRGNIIGVFGIGRKTTEYKGLREQLRQAQKMEAIGRLAGGVAHDFNNMLQVILGNLEMVMMKEIPQSMRDTLQDIQRAAEHSADLTRQLLAFARKQKILPEVIDLNKTLTDMYAMLQRLIGEDIALLWVPGEDLWPVKMDPSQINQILVNLCVNARDAIESVGKITIETSNVAVTEDYFGSRTDIVPGDYVRLTVSDDGCGMDEETVSHMFEPFFTTKPQGKGTGLGLSTVYGIVRQNAGFIKVYSEPGKGTSFKIYLPRHETEGTRETEDATGDSIHGGQETVLVVEDEESIRRLTQRMLDRMGYRVLTADTPMKAIVLAQNDSEQIDLLITDVVMPEMNGRDLAKKLLEIYPDLNCLFMSGYTANAIAHHGVLDKGVSFLQKPFTLDKLASKVREALGEA